MTREPSDETGRDGWIRPYFEDSTLWPVTFVFVVVIVTFVASVVLLALRERNPFAVAALLGLVWMSVDAVLADVRRRRLGLAAGIVLGLWGAVAAACVVALRLGAF